MSITAKIFYHEAELKLKIRFQIKIILIEKSQANPNCHLILNQPFFIIVFFY